MLLIFTNNTFLIIFKILTLKGVTSASVWTASSARLIISRMESSALQCLLKQKQKKNGIHIFQCSALSPIYRCCFFLGQGGFSEVSLRSPHLTGCAFMISADQRRAHAGPAACVQRGVHLAQIYVLCTGPPSPHGCFLKGISCIQPKNLCWEEGLFELFVQQWFLCSFFGKEGFLRGVLYLHGVDFWEGGWWFWSIWMLVWCP